MPLKERRGAALIADKVLGAVIVAMGGSGVAGTARRTPVVEWSAVGSGGALGRREGLRKTPNGMECKEEMSSLSWVCMEESC